MSQRLRIQKSHQQQVPQLGKPWEGSGQTVKAHIMLQAEDQATEVDYNAVVIEH